MTYNVGNGLASPARLVTFLRASGADVVGLQEVNAAQAGAIVDGTSDVYPYQIVRGTGFSGRGLLSRHPIGKHEWLCLVPDRPDLRVAVDLLGASVQLVVAHPPPPRLRRTGVVFDAVTIAQIDRLAETVSGSVPVILLGDFNMTMRHPSYARLVAAGFVDAYRAAGVGRGATFPVRPGRMRRLNHRLSWVPLPPIVRVDYVWHTTDFATLNAWVGAGAGSDHLPVLARLALVDDAVAPAHHDDAVAC
jgi:endonuclease/exonuclease/phosphatase family metal-dependent hydrolase